MLRYFQGALAAGGVGLLIGISRLHPGAEATVTLGVALIVAGLALEGLRRRVTSEELTLHRQEIKDCAAEVARSIEVSFKWLNPESLHIGSSDQHVTSLAWHFPTAGRMINGWNHSVRVLAAALVPLRLRLGGVLPSVSRGEASSLHNANLLRLVEIKAATPVDAPAVGVTASSLEWYELGRNLSERTFGFPVADLDELGKERDTFTQAVELLIRSARAWEETQPVAAAADSLRELWPPFRVELENIGGAAIIRGRSCPLCATYVMRAYFWLRRRLGGYHAPLVTSGDERSDSI